MRIYKTPAADGSGKVKNYLLIFDSLMRTDFIQKIHQNEVVALLRLITVGCFFVFQFMTAPNAKDVFQTSRLQIVPNRGDGSPINKSGQKVVADETCATCNKNSFIFPERYEFVTDVACTACDKDSIISQQLHSDNVTQVGLGKQLHYWAFAATTRFKKRV